VQTIEIEEEQGRKQSQTQEICFKVRAPSFTSPHLPREGFSLSTKDHSTKEHPQKNYNGLYKIGVYNSNSQSFAQKVSQSQ